MIYRHQIVFARLEESVLCLFSVDAWLNFRRQRKRKGTQGTLERPDGETKRRGKMETCLASSHKGGQQDEL